MIFPCGKSQHDSILKFIEKLSCEDTNTIFVGLQGVQGSGKSYTSQAVKNALIGKDITCVVISIDDFYYPTDQLGDSFRGHPGTHDIDLLYQTCLALKNGDIPVDIPIYDKTVNKGRGDRVGWRTILYKSRVVIIEGWCVGFTPVSTPPCSLIDVNRAVAQYSTFFKNYLNALIVLVSNAECAFEWRERAECQHRKSKNGGMTLEDTRAFVEHYQPVYRLYLSRLHEIAPLANTLYIKLMCGTSETHPYKCILRTPSTKCYHTPGMTRYSTILQY